MRAQANFLLVDVVAFQLDVKALGCESYSPAISWD